MKLITLTTLFLLAFTLQAFASNFASSLELRNYIEIDSPSYLLPSQSIVLPVSPGVDQEETSLCWTFATLNLLESNFMLRNPQVKNVSFSRAFLQRNNAEERAIRTYILKTDVFMERGDLVNAVILVEKYGLIPIDAKGYKDGYQAPLKQQLSTFATNEEKLAHVKSIVDGLFFEAPSKVSFNGKTLAPKELGALVLNNQKWIAFGFKNGAKGEWDAHPDTDAFAGLKAWYLDPSKQDAVILNSLKAGYPVAMGYSGHEVIIYGADYDENGVALKYYIKDSYQRGGTFTYEADPVRFHQVIMVLETVDIRSKL